MILILGFMGNEIYGVIDRNPTISTTSYFKNLIIDHTPQYYNSTTFDFALFVNSISGNLTLNEEYDRYVSLSVIQFD
jgi:hypothetical protein